MFGHANEENNFPHKLLLIDNQVSKLRKAFAKNNSLVNVKLLKTQLFKIIQSGPISWQASWTIIKNWFTSNVTFN